MFPFQSGVARGCGWQHIGAYINLGAFYLLGIPIAAILGFWVQLRGKGLWIGIQAGVILQAILFSIITIFTNWEKQVSSLLFFSLKASCLGYFWNLWKEKESRKIN